ncbi:MAG: hypothetical protein J6B13_06745 [Muribaculaceae bacterium]|nr:hypothetical protein [Muribaculaceae bacterium]
MKKKLLTFSFVALLGLSCYIGSMQFQQNTREYSDVVLANIEALAFPEIPGYELKLIACRHSWGNECIISTLDYQSCSHLSECP